MQLKQKLLLVALVSTISAACTHTRSAHLVNGECEEAERELISTEQRAEMYRTVREPVVEYVLVPTTYLFGWGIAAITTPMYVAGSIIAAPAHDGLRFAEDINFIPAYVWVNDDGVLVRQKHNHTSRSKSDIGGFLPYLSAVTQEPMTTKDWRTRMRGFKKEELESYYEEVLLVGECYCKRDSTEDKSKALTYLQVFESWEDRPDVKHYGYTVRDAYWTLKSLQDPTWAALNPKDFGPAHNGSIDVFLKGITGPASVAH